MSYLAFGFKIGRYRFSYNSANSKREPSRSLIYQDEQAIIRREEPPKCIGYEERWIAGGWEVALHTETAYGKEWEKELFRKFLEND